MARVHPFSALLSPLEPRLPAVATHSGAEHPAHVRPLLEAADPTAELGRWSASGLVLRDARPAFYLLEVRPSGSPVPPVRYLLCALEPEAAPPLEHHPYQPRAAQVEPAVTLAADDHGVLRALLAEAAARGVTVWEGTLGETDLVLRRIGTAALSRRVQTVLSDAPLRPLYALDARGRSLAAIVPLSDPGLQLAPIHRAVRGLQLLREETFLRLVAGYARVYELDQPLDTAQGVAEAQERLATLVRGHHAVLLVLPGGRGRILRFRQGLDLAHLKAAPRNPTLRSLDLALLNALVLRTVLGIADPETPGHPNVFAVQALDELVAGVERGTYQLGFALNPPPLWEVRAVMEAAATLPSRTFKVDPLPPPGLVFMDPSAG